MPHGCAALVDTVQSIRVKLQQRRQIAFVMRFEFQRVLPRGLRELRAPRQHVDESQIAEYRVVVAIFLQERCGGESIRVEQLFRFRRNALEARLPGLLA